MMPFKKLNEALANKPKPKYEKNQAEMDLLEVYKAQEVQRDKERMDRAKSLARDKLKKKRGATDYSEQRQD